MNRKYTTIEEKVQSDYDRLSTAFSATRKRLRWADLDAMIDELHSGDRILDIGCGTGRLCSQTEEKGVDYTGVDISSRMLEMARQNCPQGRFERGAMTDLSFEANSFDAVFHIAALHHLSTGAARRQALAEAARVLKPGGRLYLTVKAFWAPQYWKLFVQKSEGKKTLTSVEVMRLRWNDLFWPWSREMPETVYRYYHAFRRTELRTLFAGLPLEIQTLAYVRRGKTCPAYKADNLVCVAEKVVK